MSEQKVHVLFVCLGNICRSPMAEAVFRDMVRKEGLDGRIEVDSAGTGNWHIGNPPHIGTRKRLDQAGISYEGIRARQVHDHDFVTFDYIVGMDESNMEDLRRLSPEPKARVLKLLDLVPDGKGKDVPDPYFTGNFDETYELVTAGCRALLDKIKAEKALV